MITKIDDQRITGADSLVATIRSYRPGDSVERHLDERRRGAERGPRARLRRDTGLSPATGLGRPRHDGAAGPRRAPGSRPEESHAARAEPRGRGVPGEDAGVLHDQGLAGDPRHGPRGAPPHPRPDRRGPAGPSTPSGLAVPHWPVEWGGQDWTDLQRHLWHEEMQRAGVPIPLAFNASMIGPVHRPVRHAGAEGTLPARHGQPRHLVVAGLLRARRRLRPRQPAHDRGARRRRLGRQRPEDVDHARPARRLDLHARAHRPRGEEAGRHLDAAHRHDHARASRSGRSSSSTAATRSTRCGSPTCGCRATCWSGELNGGWTIAKFLLGNERVGVAPVGATKRALAALKANAGPPAGRPPGPRPGRRARERAARPRAHRPARGGALLGRRAAPGLVGPQAARHRAPAGRERARARPRRAGLARRRAPATTRRRRAGPGGPRRPTSTCARPRSTAGPTRSSARSSAARSWDSEETDMDFTYDDEQQALREAVRGLLATAYADHEARRRTVADDPGFDRALWGRLAEMGVLGLPFSEADGGVGAGPVEIGIVCQELGRVLAPEPYLAGVVHAGGLVAAVGTAEQKADLLGRLSAGEIVLAAADTSPGGRWASRADGVRASVSDGELDARRRRRPRHGRCVRRPPRRHRRPARRRHRRVRGGRLRGVGHRLRRGRPHPRGERPVRRRAPPRRSASPAATCRRASPPSAT